MRRPGRDRQEHRGGERVGRRASSYRADVLDRLWQSMPEGMRIEMLHPDCVSPRFRGAFRLQRNHPAGIDLSLLPQVMAREIRWFLFRIAGFRSPI